jgi:HlyD family secretion protein
MSNTFYSLFKRYFPTQPWQQAAAALALLGGVLILSNLLWHGYADAQADVALNDGSITVSAITLEQKPMVRTLSFSGLVTGREEVPIYSDLHQGRIKEVMVDAGDHVKAGQTLASVDASLLKIRYQQQQALEQRATVAVAQAQALLQEAKLQREQAKSERVRGDKVLEFGLLSREAVEQRATAQAIAESHAQAAENALTMAQADLYSAKGQLAESALQLQQAQISAPVTGTVTQRKAQLGLALEQFSEPLFVIVRDDVAEVEIEITSRDAQYLKTGMPASIQIQGDSQGYTGKIRHVAKQAGKRAQSALLRVRFDQSPSDALGQSAQVNIALPAKTGIYVPDTAISFEGTQSYVFTYSAGKALRVPVTLGERDANWVEVTQGLQAGMQVIDRFANLLHDGDPIKLSAKSPAHS